MGYRVLVTDMYPQRPAYAIADLSEPVDITDRDATLAAARRHHIDGVICDSTDVGVPTAAFVAQSMGLPGMGLEVAFNCTDKARLRALTASSGVRHRTVGSVDELPSAVDAIGLPLVIKPADNQSGRGVQVLRSASGATQAFERAMGFSRSGRVLLEQHLAGTELIVDGFVTDGAVTVLAVAVKTPYDDNPTLARRIHYPLAADLPVPPVQLQRVTQDTISALGLEQGVFHAELMACDDRIVPIDVAARGGGVLIYRHVIPHVSGVNVNRAMIELAMGGKPVITPRADRRCANIEFLRMPPGRFSTVLGVSEASAIEGVAAIVFNVKPGDLVGPIEDKDQRPGYIVSLCDSSAAAIDACQRAKAVLRVCLKGADAPVDMA
jgi:biotin carboxylase